MKYATFMDFLKAGLASDLTLREFVDFYKLVKNCEKPRLSTRA